MDLRGLLKFNTAPGPEYEPAMAEAHVGAKNDVRLIAYYLPQFHAIPENDAWWGKGFTEWTNVTKTFPEFSKHYQPRLPGELGFYDLSRPEILVQQANLARFYGIHGFCFHHYFFNGKKLLNLPIENLLANPAIDLPFCINWANDNWTRSWDGGNKEILLQQDYSPESDLEFAQSLEPILRDRRYIKIDGRPLIMIYRPDRLPDAQATVCRLRAHLVAAGIGEPYLIMARAFGQTDPRPYGLDALAEFPPHEVGWDGPNLADGLSTLDLGYDGTVVDYDHMVRNAKRVEKPPFVLFRGVCPGFDNSPRRQKKAFAFINGSPDKYRDWLAWTCRRTSEENSTDERIVFINAWNEWAEGAYLEPDRHFGYAFLRATSEALIRAGRPQPEAFGREADKNLRTAGWMFRSLVKRIRRKGVRVMRAIKIR